MKLLIIIILLLLLTACTPPECTIDEDCNTPMEFLVQSNCPFGSACIENQCAVVCPILDYEDYNSTTIQCSKNSDCDCSDRGDRSSDCVCHQQVCLSIEG